MVLIITDSFQCPAVALRGNLEWEIVGWGKDLGRKRWGFGATRDMFYYWHADL